MEIKRIFEVKGPDGFVPSGWNWNYIYDIWDNNFIVSHDLIETFNSKYVQIPVYDCNLNLPFTLTDYHISDVSFDHDTKNITDGSGEFSNYFMTMHPYGSIDTCTGRNTNYHENTHAFDSISKKALHYLINSNNFYLIVDYSSEGDIRDWLFDDLHTKCKEINLPAKKVIVISSAMNTRSIYEVYLKENPQTEQLYTAYYCWSLIAKKRETDHILNIENIFEFNGNSNVCSIMSPDELDNANNRAKKCLIYNRRTAPHRVIMLSLLANEKLLDSIDYSIDLEFTDQKDMGLDLSVGSDYNDVPYIENRNYRSKMIQGFFKLKKINKKTIDYEGIREVWGFGFELKEPYLNTYFSLITETLFYEHGNYISEKSFKGIAHLHPFVILGKPGILKQLKKWGFKTFSEFWDESYDDIENNSERILKVFEVTKSLVNKTNEEWDLMYKKLIPILKYNRKKLLDIGESDIIDTYIHNLNKLLKNEPNQKNYSLHESTARLF